MPSDASTTIALKPKLTRACKECITAKRKCSFELPKCTRCRGKGTSCDYENQPLTEQEVHSKPKCSVEKGLCGLGVSSQMNVISDEPCDPSPSLTWIRLDEPICTLTVDGRTLSYLNHQLKKHIISFSRTGTTTFIHPKTLPSTLLASVRLLVNTLISEPTFVNSSGLEAIRLEHVSLLNHTLGAFVAALPNLHGYNNLLSFTQSLIIIQIITLFVIPPTLLPTSIRQTTDARHRLLKRITQMLWDAAPAYLPAALSRHEAYALAESIRRTVLMSHELQAQYSMYRRGFFEYKLFGASLPFDRRFQLWDAKAGEFDEAIDMMGEGYGTQHLVSYHEFCDMFDRMEVGSVERAFETMILVGAKGLDLVEQRYGIHLV